MILQTIIITMIMILIIMIFTTTDTQGEPEGLGVKESCTDSIHSGDSGWKRNKVVSFSKSLSLSPIQIYFQFLFLNQCHCHQYKFIVSEKLSAGQYWTLVIVTALVLHPSNTNTNQTIILLLDTKDHWSKNTFNRNITKNFATDIKLKVNFFTSHNQFTSQTRKNGSIGSRVSPTALNCACAIL